jgi:ribosomal-protein-alanine N-acetyltransferase
MAHEQDWHLRWATTKDISALHRLLCIPEVYRYLADNVVPPRSAVEQWVERSDQDFSDSGIGLWLLEDNDGQLAGCVRLEANPVNRSAELTYVLHPQFWGLGLATRMSWTVMQLAFSRSNIEQIIAGADKPNTASFAVMRRLGMTFLRSVEYPAGPGSEYVFRRTDPAPSPAPEVIPESPKAR